MIEYKIITGYDRYRISEYGNVQSFCIGNEWRNRKPGIDAKGYLKVSLCDGVNKQKTFRIHRLVAMMFLSKPDKEGLIVRHLDGNSKNNHHSNLKWGTYVENEHDKKINGTWNRRFDGYALSFDKADEIREKFKNGQSQESLAEEYGVSRPTVTRLINYKIWDRNKLV